LCATRMRNPKRPVLAVPVAPTDTIDELRSEADDVIYFEDLGCFGAIGAYYADFGQASASFGGRSSEYRTVLELGSLVTAVCQFKSKRAKTPLESAPRSWCGYIRRQHDRPIARLDRRKIICANTSAGLKLSALVRRLSQRAEKKQRMTVTRKPDYRDMELQRPQSGPKIGRSIRSSRTSRSRRRHRSATNRVRKVKRISGSGWLGVEPC
jgi:hypothetical protein